MKTTRNKPELCAFINDPLHTLTEGRDMSPDIVIGVIENGTPRNYRPDYFDAPNAGGMTFRFYRYQYGSEPANVILSKSGLALSYTDKARDYQFVADSLKRLEKAYDALNDKLGHDRSAIGQLARYLACAGVKRYFWRESTQGSDLAKGAWKQSEHVSSFISVLTLALTPPQT